MNEALLKELAEAVVNAQIRIQWPLYLAMIGISLVVGFFSSYVASYAKKRGEHLAIKKDLDDLLSQIKLTTAVVEDVKAKVTHADWVTREFKTLRRLKLEELLQSIHEAHEWLDKEKGAKIYNSTVNEDDHPLPKIERICGLYFPELQNCVIDYCQEFRRGMLAILEYKQKILEVYTDHSAQNKIHDEFRPVWLPLYKQQLLNISLVEQESRKLMLEIISS